jgi:hypothetical protein
MKIRIVVLALALALMSFAPADPPGNSYYLPIVSNGCLEAQLSHVAAAMSAHDAHANHANVFYPPSIPDLNWILPDRVQTWDDDREVPNYTYAAETHLEVWFPTADYLQGPAEPITHTLTIKIDIGGVCALDEIDFIPQYHQW